jgi:hypothetical protein
MPLTASALSKSVQGLYLTSFPTCINAKFPPEKGAGIIPYAMIECMCTAWCSVLQAPNAISGLYVGVTGFAVAAAPPTVFSFPASATAIPLFNSAIGWTGTSSILVSKSFVVDIPVQSSVLGMLQLLPSAASGPGAGTPSPIMASAGTAIFTPLFQAALVAAFNAKLGANGLPLFNTTSTEVNKLILNLSSIYATIISSITFVGAYAGSPTVPVATPLSLPTAGSIL